MMDRRIPTAHKLKAVDCESLRTNRQAERNFMVGTIKNRVREMVLAAL